MEKLQLDPEKIIKEEEKEEDKYKVKHKISGDLLRQSAFDQNFITYLIQFDQIGEYAFQDDVSKGFADPV